MNKQEQHDLGQAIMELLRERVNLKKDTFADVAGILETCKLNIYEANKKNDDESQ